MQKKTKKKIITQNTQKQKNVTYYVKKNIQIIIT